MDAWSVVVLIMDAALTFEAPTWTSRVVLVMTIVWLCIRAVDEADSFGLWDLAPTARRFREYSCPTKGARGAAGLLFIRVVVF
eukprot:gene22842-19854_t